MMSTKRKVLSVIEKVAIIKDSESGVKNIAICKKYGLSSSTVSTLLKNKEPLLHAYERNLITSKRLKKCSKADLDEVLFKLYIFQKNAGLPTNCTTMKNQAETFAFQLGYENFSCTSGWLQRFRIRHNIISTKRNGETTLGTVAKPSTCLKIIVDSEGQEKVSMLKKKTDDDASIHLCKESEPNNSFSFEENGDMLESVNEPSVCLSIGQSLPDFENSQGRTVVCPDILPAELIKSEESAIQNSMPGANRENVQLLSPPSACEAYEGTEMSKHVVKKNVADCCIPINLNMLESIATATDCVEKLEYFFNSINQKDCEALNAINVIRRKLLDLVHTSEHKINS